VRPEDVCEGPAGMNQVLRWDISITKVLGSMMPDKSFQNFIMLGPECTVWNWSST